MEREWLCMCGTNLGKRRVENLLPSLRTLVILSAGDLFRNLNEEEGEEEGVEGGGGEREGAESE